ncbi:MAG TPA: antibiotic biosynthesis monooxygenase [Candidatus Bathyarchaeia archaeon]|nr:antibiotic biosynthesis monooxygenase [Candidatus Bathyarchaeia archaeon]
MYVVCVTVYVKNEFVEKFIEASLDNAMNTRNESLNLRFDVLQCLDDPTKFFLYEVYHDESGFIAHKETEHYKRWREKVEPMMAKPREGVKHKNIFPTTKDAFIAKI